MGSGRAWSAEPPARWFAASWCVFGAIAGMGAEFGAYPRKGEAARRCRRRLGTRGLQGSRANLSVIGASNAFIIVLQMLKWKCKWLDMLRIVFGVWFDIMVSMCDMLSNGFKYIHWHANAI